VGAIGRLNSVAANPSKKRFRIPLKNHWPHLATVEGSGWRNHQKPFKNAGNGVVPAAGIERYAPTDST
jgi:hypothetical protein